MAKTDDLSNRFGIEFQGAQYSTSKYFQDWLVSKKNYIRTNTYKQYEQIVKQHINPALGTNKIAGN